MSKKANPTAIGAFVVGAVGLAAAAAMIFGGGEIFREKRTFVTYFENSVKGLRVGSSVLFKGVRVGYVSEIALVLDVDTLEVRTPVVFEVLSDSLRLEREGELIDSPREQERVTGEELIAAGLRAQLSTESFVTGQLVVALDFHPDQPAVFRAVDSRHPEVPSIPSDIQQAVEKVQRFFADLQDSVDLEKLMGDLQRAVAGIEELANSRDLRETLGGLNALVNAQATQELTVRLQSSLRSFDRTLADTRQLVRGADSRIGPALDEVRRAAAQLDQTLQHGDELLTTASRQLESDSQLPTQIDRTLREVERASRSLRVLLEYLELHPEALIRGKGRP